MSENYGSCWNQYVLDEFPKIKDATDRDLVYPGDEWGANKWWKTVFNSITSGIDRLSVKEVVEIGPGSGKYTMLALEFFPNSRVFAFDVSDEFMDIMRMRLSNDVDCGRLVITKINDSPFCIRDTLRHHSVDAVDLFYSIDAMVHVDLQSLIAYLINASLVLRQGGVLAMNVADATTHRGFEKLFGDIRSFFRFHGAPSSQFSWLCPELVHHVLGELGYTVEPLSKLNGRDHHFSARLDTHQAVQDWLEALKFAPEDRIMLPGVGR